MACIDQIHINDVGTVFRVTVQDVNSSCVAVAGDVSAATTKEIIFSTPSGTVITKEAEFTTDGTDGKIQYTSVSGDLNGAGEWQLQAHIITPSGNWKSEIGRFQVLRNL